MGFKKKEVNEFLKNKKPKVVMCEKDGKNIGFMSTVLKKLLRDLGGWRYIYTHNFYVDKQYRKKGVGKLLVKHVEEYAKKNNLKKIVLCSQPQNKNAYKVYNKLCYELNEYSWPKDMK